MSIKENLTQLKQLLPPHVTLVAVSKTKPVPALMEAYEASQRDFGENYIQELLEKQPSLPADIRWHFIGHLQSNKVKYIAGFVHLVHGVDSFKLLQEINRQGAKHGRVIPCLMQLHIASEDTKFGLNEEEFLAILRDPALGGLSNVLIRGVMGMASFTDNLDQVRREFGNLKNIFDRSKALETPGMYQPEVISMGMSGDYKIAIEEGATMIRVGSNIFGARIYP